MIVTCLGIWTSNPPVIRPLPFLWYLFLKISLLTNLGLISKTTKGQLRFSLSFFINSGNQTFKKKIVCVTCFEMLLWIFHGDRVRTWDCLQLFPRYEFHLLCTLSGSDGVKIHLVDEEMRELLFDSFSIFARLCCRARKNAFMNYIQYYLKLAPHKSLESSSEMSTESRFK